MACESIFYESVSKDPSIKEFTCLSSSPSIDGAFVKAEEFTASENEEEQKVSSNERHAADPATNERQVAIPPTLSMPKECRICFCVESKSKKVVLGKAIEWMSPCRCDGSLKWVHRKCFEQWIKMAPIQQRFMCGLCGFTYQRTLQLRRIHSWSFPSVRVWWRFGLDIASTVLQGLGIWQFFKGKRYTMWILFNYFLWKKYTYPRFKNLRVITDVLETSILETKIASLEEK